MHGVCLSGASLSVGEDGRVVALETFVDEVVDVAAEVDVLLAAAFVENVVEIEVFVLVAVLHEDFLALGVSCDAGVVVVVLLL